MKKSDFFSRTIIYGLHLGLFLGAPPAAWALNKCVDAQGRVAFSDQPCPAGAQASKPDIRPASSGHAVDDVVIDSSQAAARGDVEAMRRTSANPASFDNLPTGPARDKALALLKYVAPVQVVVVSREYSADQTRAVVRATGKYRNLATDALEPTRGRIDLVRINGQWKVERSEWGPDKW